ELCALVSSLGERPIKQNFAVTGSVNQFGEVQPVGGVNEKIEGFFDACEILGLTGEQAVILPSTNQINLMLSKKVRDAIKAKRFHIYTVERVDEALELLLGEHPGVKDKDGNYPVRSMYGSILQKFDALRTAENEQEGA
ncbi:S16 family serine protease, partial [Oleiphilus sp. HI0125]